jgi:hypothetical protein
MSFHLNEKPYRNLTDDEIAHLIMQGCSCDDWNLIQVNPFFLPDNIKNTRFTGFIRLGKFDNSVNLFGGITMKTGIYNAWLHNSIVEDNALIYNIRNYIANYRICEGAIILNITTLAVEGETTFGNGVMVEPINEGGGREVPIFDYLSAHTAYIMSLYRHREKVIRSLSNMINNYIENIKSSQGIVGPYSKIINCNTITNVRIGPATHIEGAKKLNNGSINSTFDDPVVIGEGVIMDDFIVSSGTRIADSTLVTKCFVGQGCILDRHYSAINSLFFANCHGSHGEACSIFAGPFTVTHHKSTLLIAGMFSFLNAGSGSNQSNHMYKLGPIHQGIVERGAKTTSDSYLLWPSRIGAFSLVMGRHYKHSDTTDFPFSYFIESNDESILVPGVNLKSIGTIRDSKKWPTRDRRKDSNLLDFINYNLLSPYTIQKMIKGRQILLEIRKVSGQSAHEYSYHEMKIRKNALDRGIELYEMAIWKFIGNSLITRIKRKPFDQIEQMRDALKKDTPVGEGNWIDLSGLICPAEALEKLLTSIETGEINTFEEVNATLRSIHLNYYNYEWTWAYGILEEFYGKKLIEFEPEDVIKITKFWEKSVLGIDQMLYDDAKKEFSLAKMTGFGVDGSDNAKEMDFSKVRGDFENNDTVRIIRNHMETKKKLGEEIIEKMESLKKTIIGK